MNFYGKRELRRIKFTNHIKKQKTINEVCKRITGKQHVKDRRADCIVGFGNWSARNNPIRAGERVGPVVYLRQELAKWCTVVVIDEYKTSQRCSGCNRDRTVEVVYNGESCRKVLRCPTCGIFFDRDVNAARNIFSILDAQLHNMPRPQHLLNPYNNR